jgi:hypothetical protein
MLYAEPASGVNTMIMAGMTVMAATTVLMVVVSRVEIGKCGGRVTLRKWHPEFRALRKTKLIKELQRLGQENSRIPG